MSFEREVFDHLVQARLMAVDTGFPPGYNAAGVIFDDFKRKVVVFSRHWRNEMNL